MAEAGRDSSDDVGVRHSVLTGKQVFLDFDTDVGHLGHLVAQAEELRRACTMEENGDLGLTAST
jgi:hypothetical protein